MQKLLDAINSWYRSELCEYCAGLNLEVGPLKQEGTACIATKTKLAEEDQIHKYVHCFVFFSKINHKVAPSL